MAETSTLTTLEYGDPHDFKRCLIAQGEPLNRFLNLEQAHPFMVLVILNKSPNDLVYEDGKHANAESLLDGGFLGQLSSRLPFAVLDSHEHSSTLYEKLGLKGEDLAEFLEAYNAWVTQAQKQLKLAAVMSEPTPES